MQYEPKTTQAVDQLTDEVEWMAARLREARADIADAPLVVKYLDTNGNERVKTNPAYDSYAMLLSAFIKAARAKAELTGEEPDISPEEFTLDSISVVVNPLKVAR